MTSRQRAWIAAATQALGQAESWTGRIHLHKHLFITQILCVADVPFDFELYHYGPYSFSLDNAIAEMESFGELDKNYRQPGYGPSYELTEFGEESLQELSKNERGVASKIATSLGGFNSSDLELIATCLWVEIREDETDTKVIEERVKEIKPKYPLSRIQWALEKARELRSTFAH